MSGSRLVGSLKTAIGLPSPDLSSHAGFFIFRGCAVAVGTHLSLSLLFIDRDGRGRDHNEGFSAAYAIREDL